MILIFQTPIGNTSGGSPSVDPLILKARNWNTQFEPVFNAFLSTMTGNVGSKSWFEAFEKQLNTLNLPKYQAMSGLENATPEMLAQFKENQKTAAANIEAKYLTRNLSQEDITKFYGNLFPNTPLSMPGLAVTDYKVKIQEGSQKLTNFPATQTGTNVALANDWLSNHYNKTLETAFGGGAKSAGQLIAQLIADGIIDPTKGEEVAKRVLEGVLLYNGASSLGASERGGAISSTWLPALSLGENQTVQLSYTMEHSWTGNVLKRNDNITSLDISLLKQDKSVAFTALHDFFDYQDKKSTNGPNAGEQATPTAEQLQATTATKVNTGAARANYDQQLQEFYGEIRNSIVADLKQESGTVASATYRVGKTVKVPGTVDVLIGVGSPLYNELLSIYTGRDSSGNVHNNNGNGSAWQKRGEIDKKEEILECIIAYNKGNIDNRSNDNRGPRICGGKELYLPSQQEMYEYLAARTDDNKTPAIRGRKLGSGGAGGPERTAPKPKPEIKPQNSLETVRNILLAELMKYDSIDPTRDNIVDEHSSGVNIPLTQTLKNRLNDRNESIKSVAASAHGQYKDAIDNGFWEQLPAEFYAGLNAEQRKLIGQDAAKGNRSLPEDIQKVLFPPEDNGSEGPGGAGRRPAADLARTTARVDGDQILENMKNIKGTNEVKVVTQGDKQWTNFEQLASLINGNANPKIANITITDRITENTNPADEAVKGTIASTHWILQKADEAYNNLTADLENNPAAKALNAKISTAWQQNPEGAAQYLSDVGRSVDGDPVSVATADQLQRHVISQTISNVVLASEGNPAQPGGKSLDEKTGNQTTSPISDAELIYLVANAREGGDLTARFNASGKFVELKITGTPGVGEGIKVESESDQAEQPYLKELAEMLNGDPRLNDPKFWDKAVGDFNTATVKEVKNINGQNAAAQMQKIYDFMQQMPKDPHLGVDAKEEPRGYRILSPKSTREEQSNYIPDDRYDNNLEYVLNSLAQAELTQKATNGQDDPALKFIDQSPNKFIRVTEDSSGQPLISLTKECREGVSNATQRRIMEALNGGLGKLNSQYQPNGEPLAKNLGTATYSLVTGTIIMPNLTGGGNKEKIPGVVGSFRRPGIDYDDPTARRSSSMSQKAIEQKMKDLEKLAYGDSDQLASVQTGGDASKIKEAKRNGKIDNLEEAGLLRSYMQDKVEELDRRATGYSQKADELAGRVETLGLDGPGGSDLLEWADQQIRRITQGEKGVDPATNLEDITKFSSKIGTYLFKKCKYSEHDAKIVARYIQARANANLVNQDRWEYENLQSVLMLAEQNFLQDNKREKMGTIAKEIVGRNNNYYDINDARVLAERKRQRDIKNTTNNPPSNASSVGKPLAQSSKTEEKPTPTPETTPKIEVTQDNPGGEVLAE